MGKRRHGGYHGADPTNPEALVRHLSTTAALLVLGASTLGAQAQPARPITKDADPTRTVAAGALPSGWRVRLDDKDATRYTVNDTRFVAMGQGWHVTSGPAALYYNPAHTAPAETYTVRATMTQTKAPRHPEAYGIFLSARNLENSETQDYAYFLVRGTGEYMVNHRAGRDVHKIIPWTASPAVNKADANGKQTNTLEARVGTDSVRFVVNGTSVAAVSRDHWRNTAGIAGLRVNHNLDVHVDAFEIVK